MNIKKLFIVLLVVGSLMGAVYGAAATLTITGEDTLGAAGVTTVTPDGLTVTDITYTLLSSDPTLIDDVTVEITNANATTPLCDVGVTLSTTGPTFEEALLVTAQTMASSSTKDVVFAMDESTVAEGITDTDIVITCEE